MVPFLDLYRSHEPLLEKFHFAFDSIVKRSAFINGPEVAQFEKNFASWVGTQFCLGLSNGTDAEVIALQALGLKRGDKVVLPAMTFVATIEAVVFAGGTPVLVDVDQYGLIDLDQAEKELAKGARYLFPVHLYGQIVDPERLIDLKKRYGCLILEDACQAHGASLKGWKAGAIGDASAFSFYPGKNLGALGDGGALCTNSAAVFNTGRALREHGQSSKNVFDYVGHTARLDTLQAAFLDLKLPFMSNWTKDRIRAAKFYVEALEGVPGLSLQSSALDGSHVYHLFVVLTERRKELTEAFNQEKIGWGMHYPVSLNKIKCYGDAVEGSFPNSEKFAQLGISLPIFPGITQAELEKVVRIIRMVHPS